MNTRQADYNNAFVRLRADMAIRDRLFLGILVSVLVGIGLIVARQYSPLSLRRLVLAFVLVATLAGPASALGEDEWSRFQLWTKCGPVGLEVTTFIPDEVIKSEGRNPETMIETVQTAVRSRLRAARIRSERESLLTDSLTNIRALTRLSATDAASPRAGIVRIAPLRP